MRACGSRVSRCPNDRLNRTELAEAVLGFPLPCDTEAVLGLSATLTEITLGCALIERKTDRAVLGFSATP